MAVSFVIVFRDIFTQFVMKRTFFMEHSFLRDLRENDTVVLAECDAISPSKGIREYLERHHPKINLVWRIDVGHGEVLYNPKFVCNIIADVIVNVCNKEV